MQDSIIHVCAVHDVRERFLLPGPFRLRFPSPQPLAQPRAAALPKPSRVARMIDRYRQPHRRRCAPARLFPLMCFAFRITS